MIRPHNYDEIEAFLDLFERAPAEAAKDEIDAAWTARLNEMYEGDWSLRAESEGRG